MSGKALRRALRKWRARQPLCTAFGMPPFTPYLACSFSDCLFFLLSASESLHFCSQHLSFVFPVMEQNHLVLWSVSHWIDLLTSTGARAIIPAHGLVCRWSRGRGEILVKPFLSPIHPCPVLFAFVQGSFFTCSAQSMPDSHCSHAPLAQKVMCRFEIQFRNYPFIFHLHVLNKFPSIVSKTSLFLHISSE